MFLCMCGVYTSVSLTFTFIYKCTILSFSLQSFSNSASQDHWIFMPNSCTPSIFHTTDLSWNLLGSGRGGGGEGGGWHGKGRKLNPFIYNKRQITILNTSLPVLLNSATLTLLSIECTEFLPSAQVTKGYSEFLMCGVSFPLFKEYISVYIFRNPCSLCAEWYITMFPVVRLT